ncbi:5-oxoprolinase subunit PxpC [Erwinia psidii]|uniref:Biotin-dependent carboxyltransferase family protein n=1 Tax=Erwinia psidii TaxID=69224 RepID=A0A3N6UXB1_9GAMM|nr:5-oxoprolinase subunit PxpC [Erwinia psidii]MCX8957153.1 biotin-dependent carboxyltransferase family protein [Erwinia psidii]MCX8961805.1 biotin-dependent carboxyltransferase family protein [Erwinia psidii]MCX8965399.1 biotin-dependent carboxyltransferase family protein [Erwinia psidii]RQM37475.1 biotin-dependent carboxyltransferase family protein [Erwinia psidii]
MLKIIRAGMSTTLQDAGRSGWRQYGVGVGGVLDRPAMEMANLLVGNDRASAVLEITLGQFCAEFTRDGWIALTGAGCDAMLDSRPVWTGWRTAVSKGQRLMLKMPTRGMRSYLALDGGFAIAPVLGSCSTDVRAGFGGFAGRQIADGDRVPQGEPRRRFTRSAGVRQWLSGNRVRALSGPEYDEFSTESRELFWRTAWQLNPQSNRMGYRLQGGPLIRENPREMLSHGLLPGVVQVPPNGQPIVLMADAQTTGGYPRIACVIEADLYQLAQLRLGEPVHFIRCTTEEALEAMRVQQRCLEQIAWGLENAY